LQPEEIKTSYGLVVISSGLLDFGALASDFGQTAPAPLPDEPLAASIVPDLFSHDPINEATVDSVV
jgi:hypothetical protein